jgi:hypothetical protein
MILHTSDWHLGAPVGWPTSEDRLGPWTNLFRRLRKQAVEDTIDHAIKNSVEAVLVSGDVTDVYGNIEQLKDIYHFLRSSVIAPLRDHGIKPFFALGSHDVKALEAAELFVLLAKEFKGAIELFLPEKSEEMRVLMQNFDPKKTKLFKDTVVWEDLTIACDTSQIKGRWIQFKHEGNESTPNPINPPIYRALGDKHAMTYGRNGCYYPGTPFARSSASDNGYTDAGPRYCLLYEVSNSVPTPIRLRVPEVAVFEKSLNQDEWQIFYEPDYKRATWLKESPYKESVDNILERVLHEKPHVSFVTFVINKKEEDTFSYIVFQKAVDFTKTRERVIQGSRRGIITAMLRPDEKRSSF